MDNLEQLEKDWPQKRPKNLTSRGIMRLNLAGAAIFSVSAIFSAVVITVRAKSHHVEL